jgi:hypothetical protein
MIAGDLVFFEAPGGVRVWGTVRSISDDGQRARVVERGADPPTVHVVPVTKLRTATDSGSSDVRP